MLDTGLDDPLGALRPDPEATSPMYLQLVERVAAAIAGGQLRDGEALPPERLLSERLEVSRTTVRKALDELVARGLITSRRGSGNFVAARIEQPLARLSGFTEDMRARGRKPSFVWLQRALVAAGPEETVALALATGERVARLVRLRFADDEPLAIERATIAARDLPTPEAVEGSLYAALRKRGVEPVRALQRLRAEAAGDEDAKQLDLAPGSPVMATVRHGYLADGRPVEFTRSVYRGDRYDFVAELRRS
jgi:GntR family transcriptional regulator